MKRQSEIAYLPKWNANDDDDDDNDLNYDIYFDMQPFIQMRFCSVSESIPQIKLSNCTQYVFSKDNGCS